MMATLAVWPNGPISASIARAPVNLSGFIFLMRGASCAYIVALCDADQPLGRRPPPAPAPRHHLRITLARRTPAGARHALQPQKLEPAVRRLEAPQPPAKAHEHALVALVAQPGAHRFLHMNGLAWRLALAYGPPTLVGSALYGPSWLVRDANRGDIAGLPVACSGDRLYPGEEDILVHRRRSTGSGSAKDVQQLLIRNVGALAYGVVDLSSPPGIPRDTDITGQE